MGIYKIFNDLNNHSLFQYIVIIILFLFFYQSKKIGLNIILALFLAGVTILYIHDKNTTLLEIEEKEYKQKEHMLNPSIEKIDQLQNRDIIDLIFSIQDYYYYNPEAFEEMSDNINNLLTIQEIILKDEPLCEYYYQIAESKKDNALNSLHSIIFNLPNDNITIDKLTRAHKRLETILNKYLNIMYDKCHNKVITEGYNIYKKPIILGPKPANKYFDKQYTYQFY